MKTRKLKVYKSIDEMPHVYVPVEELERNLDADAAWAEKHYGPNVPRLTPRGRPRKGTKPTPTLVHSLRVREDILNAVRAKAKALGISTNAALQIAASAWANPLVRQGKPVSRTPRKTESRTVRPSRERHGSG